jgi:arylsulfatase A-like enzyme
MFESEAKESVVFPAGFLMVGIRGRRDMRALLTVFLYHGPWDRVFMKNNRFSFSCCCDRVEGHSGGAWLWLLFPLLLFSGAAFVESVPGQEGAASFTGTAALRPGAGSGIQQSLTSSFQLPYRFQEHLEEVVSSELGPVAVGSSTVQVWPPPDSASPRDVGPAEGVTVTDGLLRLDTDRGGVVILTEELGIYTADTASVALELKVTGNASLRLSWRFRTFPWGEDIQELAGSFIDFPVLPDGAMHIYDVRVDNVGAWRENRIIDGLQIHCNEAGSVAIARVEIRNRSEVFAQEGMGARVCAVGGDIRQALFMRVPARVTYRLRLPERAVFAAGLAAVQKDNPVTFQVSVRTGEKQEVVLREERIGAETWSERRADLAAYAGQEAEIELAAMTDQPGQVALWSNPSLFESKGDTPPGDRPNIVVYLVDALRADRLEAYGHHRVTAPAVTELARNGVRFEQCFSQETCTKPSVMTLYSGMDSQVHGYTCNGGPQFKNELPFFSTFLRERGYTTASISQNAYAPPPSSGRTSFCRQVELFGVNDSVTEDTYIAAASFLEAHQDRPFYLYIHTMECHELWTPDPESCPYALTPPFDQVYKDPEHAYPPDRYDGSITYADYNFKRVREKLDELGLLKNTLVIFTSDHGYALGERGEWAHGKDPYRDQVHVPLVLSWPAGGIGPVVIADPVQLADIGPTLLDLIGAPVPETCQGVSLLPLVRGDNASFIDRPIFSYNGWTGSASVTRGAWKLFRNEDSGERLYRTAGNVPETEDLAGAYPEITAELYQALKNHLRHNRQIAETIQVSPDAAEEISVDPVKLEILKSLGYISD